MKLFVAVALLVIALALGAAFLLLAQDNTPESIVQAVIAGRKFAYARGYARDDATGAGGLADRLSFVVSFPTFAPLKSRRTVKQSVALTVAPKDDGLDPAERPSKLYARFLTPETFEGPGGLILRRFEAGSPYDSEELFIAPPDGRNFFARCPKSQAGVQDEGCISVFRDGGLDVELRYPAALLEQWDAIYDGARGLLARMNPAAARKKKR